jgi:hypothetical protein
MAETPYNLKRIFPLRVKSSRSENAYMFGLWDTKSRNGYYVDNNGVGQETSTNTVLAKLAYSEFAKLEGQKVYSSEVAKIFIEANQSQCDYLVFMPITTSIINATKFMASLDAFVDSTSFMVAGHLSAREAESPSLNDTTYYHNPVDHGKNYNFDDADRFCAFYDHMFVIDIGLYKTHGSYNFGERTSLMSTIHRQEFSEDWDNGLHDEQEVHKLEGETAAQIHIQSYDLPADIVGWQLANDAVNANQPVVPLPQNLRTTYYNCYYPTDDYGPSKMFRESYRMGRPDWIQHIDDKENTSIPLIHLDEKFCGALDGANGYNWVRSLDTDKVVIASPEVGEVPVTGNASNSWSVTPDQLEWFDIMRHYAQYKEDWGIGSLQPAYNLQTLATTLDSIEYSDIASVSALSEITKIEKVISVCNGLSILRWIDELPIDTNTTVWWMGASNTAMDFQRQIIQEITKPDFNSITWSYETFYKNWLNTNTKVPTNWKDILENELETSLVFDQSYLTPGNLNKLATMKHKFIPFSYKPFNVFQTLPLALLSEHQDDSDPNHVTETLVDFDDLFISPFYQMNMQASMVEKDGFSPQRHIPEVQYQKFINFLKEHSVLQGLSIFLYAYWPASETSVNKQMY